MRKNILWGRFFTLLGVVLLVASCAGKPRETYQPPQNEFDVFARGVQNGDAKEGEVQYDPKRRSTSGKDVEAIRQTWFTGYGDTEGNLIDGERYLSVGLLDKAQQEFLMAIDYDPFFGPAYIGLGRTYLKKNMLSHAEQTLLRAIELSPDRAEGFYYLALTYCRLLENESDPRLKQEYRQKAQLHANTTRRLEADFADPDGILDGDCTQTQTDTRPSVLIQTDPSPAEVYLGQTYVGASPVTIKIDLAHIHDVTAEKEGYILQSRRIRFESDSLAILSILLEPEDVYVPMRPSNIPLETFELSDKVMFDLNKADLKPEAQALLNEVGMALQNHPDSPIRITGHTCDLGSAEYNQKLSERRAQAVADYLSRNFNISQERMIVIGKGESEPLVPNTSEENRRKNRRTVIDVMDSTFNEMGE